MILLGAALVVAPFVALFAAIWHIEGWRGAVQVFAWTLALVAPLALGLWVLDYAR